MSEQDGGRATVAQVLAEVKGLRDFTDARFTDVQRQLDGIKGVPERLARLEEQVGKLEGDAARRSNVVPGILIGVFGLFIAVINILVVLGHVG